MLVQCPDLGLIVYLGMRAHYALPDKRPRRAQDLTPVLKDRSWPVAAVGPGSQPVVGQTILQTAANDPKHASGSVPAVGRETSWLKVWRVRSAPHASHLGPWNGLNPGPLTNFAFSDQRLVRCSWNNPNTIAVKCRQPLRRLVHVLAIYHIQVYP